MDLASPPGEFSIEWVSRFSGCMTVHPDHFHAGAGSGSLTVTVRRDASRSPAFCLGCFRPMGMANMVLVMGQRTAVMFVTSVQTGDCGHVPDVPESGSTTTTSATTCWETCVR